MSQKFTEAAVDALKKEAAYCAQAQSWAPSAIRTGWHREINDLIDAIEGNDGIDAALVAALEAGHALAEKAAQREAERVAQSIREDGDGDITVFNRETERHTIRVRREGSEILITVSASARTVIDEDGCMVLEPADGEATLRVPAPTPAAKLVSSEDPFWPFGVDEIDDDEEEAGAICALEAGEQLVTGGQGSVTILAVPAWLTFDVASDEEVDALETGVRVVEVYNNDTGTSMWFRYPEGVELVSFCETLRGWCRAMKHPGKVLVHRCIGAGDTRQLADINGVTWHLTP